MVGAVANKKPMIGWACANEFWDTTWRNILIPCSRISLPVPATTNVRGNHKQCTKLGSKRHLRFGDYLIRSD